jgi:hypothetical protein
VDVAELLSKVGIEADGKTETAGVWGGVWGGEGGGGEGRGRVGLGVERCGEMRVHLYVC